EGVGDGAGEAAHRDRAHDLGHDVLVLGGGRLTGEVHRDLGVDLLVAPYGKEVDVHHVVLHRVPLDLAGQGDVGVTGDGEADEGVEAGVGGQSGHQLAPVDGHGNGLVHPGAVHDTGDAALRPQAPRLGAAGRRARVGLEGDVHGEAKST